MENFVYINETINISKTSKLAIIFDKNYYVVSLHLFLWASNVNICFVKKDIVLA